MFRFVNLLARPVIHQHAPWRITVKDCYIGTDMYRFLQRSLIGTYRFMGYRHRKRPDAVELPRLTPHMVSAILRMNEEVVAGNHGAIKSYVINWLQANKPTEDRNFQGRLVHGGASVFGVVDGHLGFACAQAVSDRLLAYIGVAMADDKVLKKIIDGATDPMIDLIQYREETEQLSETDLTVVQKMHLMKFALERQASQRGNESRSVTEALVSSFVRLDNDISQEAMPGSLEKSEMDESFHLDTLTIAFSGAVVCVAYIDNTDLFVANVGDSQAVLGVHNHDRWDAVPLSKVHNAKNPNEMKRIRKCHPNESSNIIRNGRLFGELMPLRTFGNVRFKWSETDLQHLLNATHIPKPKLISAVGEALVPGKYHTPPYLSAEPEVMHHKLTPKDKFLVLASDGLWDCLSAENVVELVAGHMDGEQVLVNYTPPEGATLKEVNAVLTERASSQKNVALDSNAATHLLRCALGPDHGEVSAQLTLPQSIVRQFRDDMTVIVIFFDSEYIRQVKVIPSHQQKHN